MFRTHDQQTAGAGDPAPEGEIGVVPTTTEVDAPVQASVDVSAPEGRRRRRNPIGYWLAWFWLALIVPAAVLAPFLPLWNPAEPDFTAIGSLPSLDHPLGADALGRDTLSRIIFGARASLLVGICAVAMGMVIGGSLGIVAGYVGGRVERLLMVVTDAILAFPGLVLLLAIVAVLGASLTNLILGLGILAVPTFVRLARANTLVVAQREYVMAARAYGSRTFRIMIREVVPNVVLPVAAYGFIMIGIFIVAEGSLSFLGLGIPPPDPSWGSMIAGGRRELIDNPHIALTPAAVMFFTVLAINYIGERVRKKYDVKDSHL